MLLTISSVGRVLDLFSVETPERGVTEVASLLGVSRSKAHALLASMTAIGLLRRVPGGRYRIGWRALALSRVVATTTDWVAPAHQAARALVGHFGETVHIATYDQGRVVYVDRVLGRDSLRLPHTASGSRLPAHCSGVGKVLLAGLPEAEADEVLARHGMPAATTATVTDPRELREALGVVRERGWAQDCEEALEGVSCIAAAVRDRSGATVAALSVSAPTRRLRRREAELCCAVAGAARTASDALRPE